MKFCIFLNSAWKKFFKSTINQKTNFKPVKRFNSKARIKLVKKNCDERPHSFFLFIYRVVNFKIIIYLIYSNNTTAFLPSTNTMSMDIMILEGCFVYKIDISCQDST